MIKYNKAIKRYDSFAVIQDEVRDENLLLVDDMVDSGWTFTVCGYKLIRAGSRKVFPFALANTGNGGGRT